jgi:hypothetical protein
LLFIPILGFSQYTAIPDQNFEQALIDLGHDDVIDGQVLTANISGVELLDVSGNWSQSSNISYLTGIESFMALTELDCSINQLTSLDVSQNTALTSLNCSDNQLTSLDVSGCTALEDLICAGNQLTSLDVSGCTALEDLICAGNQLTSLDLNGCTALTDLNCSGNSLTSLDISQNLSLYKVECWNNSISNLNINGLTNLIQLDCSFNQLSIIDLTTNDAIEEFWCNNNNLNTLILQPCSNSGCIPKLSSIQCQNNQLTSIDITGLPNMEDFDCRNNNISCLKVNVYLSWDNWGTFETTFNPNLFCIETDNLIWSQTNWTVDNGSIDTQTSFSENCNYPAGCNYTTNIKEYQSNLSIYPNPTNYIIQIEIENYNGNFEAELYDFTGKLLKTANNTSLSLVDYPSGIYLLKVAYGDSVEQLKVVKE